jgi:hypothetical protein
MGESGVKTFPRVTSFKIGTWNIRGGFSHYSRELTLTIGTPCHHHFGTCTWKDLGFVGKEKN